MIALTLAPPGATVIPFKIDEKNEAGRTECYLDEPDPKQFTVMEHLEAKDKQPGILMFDAKGTVHGLKKVPYSLFEIQTKASPGQTELV